LQTKDRNTAIDVIEKNQKIITAKELQTEAIITEEEFLTDETGRKYKDVEKVKEIPRKTYVLGQMHGKYWGELDQLKSDEYMQFRFYDFRIYEIWIDKVEYKFSPFLISSDIRFPREKLPALLPITLLKDGKEYAVSIREPLLANVCFDRKLHQDEGHEVFGTIYAQLTGYILDYIPEVYTERIYVEEHKDSSAVPVEAVRIIKTSIPTGNVDFKDDYSRNEYYYSDYKTKYWGDWKYKRRVASSSPQGCLSSGLGIIGSIISIVLLFLVLPRLGILLPFLLLPLLFQLISPTVWSWILRILAGLIVLIFLYSIISGLGRDSTRTYIPRPIVQDPLEERGPVYDPVTDTANNIPFQDTLITHYRKWEDYDGNKYEGKIWVKLSSFSNAQYYKKQLGIAGARQHEYDEILYRLKENDKGDLSGIYQLFDSLRKEHFLNNKLFAEMIVSFVQDIPYSLILPDACDPSLYSDEFISNYLRSDNAICVGYQKFGINTPIEFMATLKGDCDSRTLLLYTILAHYGYDIALLSSEYYNHSILGINLPYDGIAYRFRTQRYTLWETTVPHIKPGVLPKEISNLNYWRISLKSK